MGSADFSLGQDDGGVPWDDVIRDFDGDIVDMTGGYVELQFRLQDETQPAIGGAGSVLNGPAGKVRYVFPSTQTGVPGMYNASWIAVTAAGEQITWPPELPLELRILPKV